MNLERIFLYNDHFIRDKQFPVEDDLPFMALCQRCRLYFNQLKNDQEMLCLYHPGVFIQTLLFITNILLKKMVQSRVHYILPGAN